MARSESAQKLPRSDEETHSWNDERSKAGEPTHNAGLPGFDREIARRIDLHILNAFRDWMGRSQKDADVLVNKTREVEGAKDFFHLRVHWKNCVGGGLSLGSDQYASPRTRALRFHRQHSGTNREWVA